MVVSGSNSRTYRYKFVICTQLFLLWVYICLEMLQDYSFGNRWLMNTPSCVGYWMNAKQEIISNSLHHIPTAFFACLLSLDEQYSKSGYFHWDFISPVFAFNSKLLKYPHNHPHPTLLGKNTEFSSIIYVCIHVSTVIVTLPLEYDNFVLP